jgi:predicted amidohydrolase YtcJ
VLDRNILDGDPHDIHRAKVVVTMMNGRIVHESGTD